MGKKKKSLPKKKKDGKEKYQTNDLLKNDEIDDCKLILDFLA